MNSTSYMKRKYPIMKRNHEKIKVRLKPDTPMHSQIIDVSQKYDNYETLDEEIEKSHIKEEQKVLYMLEQGFTRGGMLLIYTWLISEVSFFFCELIIFDFEKRHMIYFMYI
jgi:hypothetical protein